MHWPGKLMAILLAALWLPMVAHCPLERLTDSILLACCCEDDAAGAPNRDCAEQVCSLIESGSVKHEDEALSLPPPLLTEVFELVPAPMLDEQPTGSVVRYPDRRPSPPVWPRWLRTVQPPRAPTPLLG